MKRKILIVDDAAGLCKTIREFLKMKGYITLKAKDGKEAVEKCRSENPHLVLMDVFLPGEFGLDVALTIADEFPSARPKITVISGTPGGEMVGSEEFKMANRVNLFLKNPFELEELLTHINKLLAEIPVLE